MTPPRRRPRSWPTSPPSTAPPPSRTRSPCWTPTRTRRRTARWSAGPTCRTPATSCTTSAGTRAAARSARTAPHPHVERRYLIVPGLRSSRIYVLDTKDDPRQPSDRQGASSPRSWPSGPATRRPHTVHCGPEGIYVSALGGADGEEGPGGIAAARPHHLRGARARGRSTAGPQYLAYDFWWHLAQDVAGDQRVGHPVDDRGRPGRRAAAGPQVRPRAALLGPAAAPARAGGRPRRPVPDGAGAAAGARPDQGVRLRRRGRLSVEDLSASIWVWHRGRRRAGRPPR